MGLAFALAGRPASGPILAAIWRWRPPRRQSLKGRAAGHLFARPRQCRSSSRVAVDRSRPFLVRFRTYLPYVEKTIGRTPGAHRAGFLFGVFTQLNTWLIEYFPVLQTIGEEL